MPEQDPFLIQPEVWFAVLCERASHDAEKRIQLINVFNRWYMDRPPEASGIRPHAHVRADLAVGVSAGLGEFTGNIEIQDVDGRVLSSAPAIWRFAMGPGETMGATLFANVDHWFSEIGNYFFIVRLQPGGLEVRVRLEIAERPDAKSAGTPST